MGLPFSVRLFAARKNWGNAIAVHFICRHSEADFGWGRCRRDLHGRCRLRPSDRRAPARQDPDDALATCRRDQSWRSQGKRGIPGRGPFSSRRDDRDQYDFRAQRSETGLLITRGFRDIYEIGRVNRPEAYNLFFRRHRPLVGRDLRQEINERVTAEGEVLQPLDEDEVLRAARLMVEAGCEAISTSFCIPTPTRTTRRVPRRWCRMLSPICS